MQQTALYRKQMVIVNRKTISVIIIKMQTFNEAEYRMAFFEVESD